MHQQTMHRKACTTRCRGRLRRHLAAVAATASIASISPAGCSGGKPAAHPRPGASTGSQEHPGAGTAEVILTEWGPAIRLRRRTFSWTLTARGKLEPLDEAKITVQTWGVITRMWEDGAPVKKDDVVLELDRHEKERRIADRAAEVVVREAELVKTRQRHAKLVKSAEMAVGRAEYELEWQRLNREILLLGATAEETARAEKELETLELVESNRAEELAILEDLARRGFATTGEVERKRLQLAEAKLEAEKARITRKRLRDGATELKRREAELEVKIAEYALESARKRVGSAEAACRSAIAHAEKGLASERHKLDHDTKELEKYTIRSPTDGFILHAPGRWGHRWAPGSHVGRGSKVMTIPSEGRVKVKTRVGHSVVESVKEGLPCRVTVAAKPDEPYDGKVLRVSSQGRDEYEDLDSFTKDKVAKAGRKTFDVEVEVLRKDPSLKPGFRAEAEFLLGEVEGALVVPWGTVGPIRAGGGGGTHLNVIAEGRVERRAVELGPSNETHVVIESGCEEGELVLLAYAWD